MFDETKPQNKQIGGSHYMYFDIQPYEFISKNNLSFFQGCVVKYVCRYMHKNGIEDLDKIIHYCELEKKKLRDTKKKKKLQDKTWIKGYKKWKKQNEDTSV